MVIIILLILLFIIYNFRNIEKFTQPVLSPNVTNINRTNDTLDISFEKDINDNIQPNDDYFYEIYYKKENQLLESEIDRDMNLDTQKIIFDSWQKEDIKCSNIKCNHIMSITNDTYYFFILTNLDGRRSVIKKIYRSNVPSEFKVYPPDILQIIKKEGECDVFFKRSGRDTSTPRDKFIYEIYYAKEYDVNYSPTPSDSISPSPSGEYDNWFKKIVICDKLKCVTKINDLEDETYLFFIIQIKNGRRSKVRKIVKVSNETPYKPITYRLEDYQSGFSSNEDTSCSNFSYENCPDQLTGTILSRCYKDKELNRCIQSVEEEYLQ